MKKVWVAVISAMLMVGLSIGTAEAKRFGGGSSFGSKPSHSQPQKSDAMPDSKPGGSQAAAPASPAAPGAAAAPRRGFGGMMGGMLGGLLMGGLLGSLFAGGAFENINFMDILVFAGLAFGAFMLFKHFAKRRQPEYAAAPAYSPPVMNDVNSAPNVENAYQRSAMSMPGSSGAARPALVLPAGFDSKEFLDGAKGAFEMMQKAWDTGELADIRGLTTDKVFAEVQDQYRARAGENRTEVKEMRAELIDIKEVDGQQEASVMFDSLMSEYDANSPMIVDSVRVREVWHFVRAKSSLRPTWLLDGIQQVEG